MAFQVHIINSEGFMAIYISIMYYYNFVEIAWFTTYMTSSTH